MSLFSFILLFMFLLIRPKRRRSTDIISQYLSTCTITPFVIYGEPFHFMKSTIISVPTGQTATSIEEFVQVIETVDASAIYNHMFEARQRIRKSRSDFASWIEESLGMTELADDIEGLDCYMYSLEGLREKLLELCRRESVS